MRTSIGCLLACHWAMLSYGGKKGKLDRRACYDHFRVPSGSTPINTSKQLFDQGHHLAHDVFDHMRKPLKQDFNYVFMLANFAMSVPKASLTGPAFREFTRRAAEGGLWKPMMRGVSFIPRVRHNNTDPAWASIHYNRSDWEADGALFWEPQTSYRIAHQELRGSSEYKFTKGSTTMEEAEEYYIVQYISPIDGNVEAIGLNMGNDLSCLNAMKTAERIQGHTVTSRIQIVQSSRSQRGFLLMYPLFHDVNNPSYFTEPGRGSTALNGTPVAPVPSTQLRPMGFVVGTFVMEELVDNLIQEHFLHYFEKRDISFIALVYARIGYPGITANEGDWQLMAGTHHTFNASQDRTDIVAIERFNMEWASREKNIEIVAHEVLCDSFYVDNASSEWLLIVALDYGCPPGSYMISPPLPGQILTQCAACPLYSTTFSHGPRVFEDCECAPGYAWSATGSCVPCSRGSYLDSYTRDASCKMCPPQTSTVSVASRSLRDCICSYGFERNDRGDCVSCAAFWNSKLGERCELRPEAVLVVIVVVVLGILLTVGFWVIVAMRRRLSQFREEKQKAVERRLEAGLSSISNLSHPMVCISATDFMALDDAGLSNLHEGLRNQGKLVTLDTVEEVRTFKTDGVCIALFSYEWLSWDRKGPDAVQTEAMKSALGNLTALLGSRKEKLFVWLDILSIPQQHPRLKALAVDALYSYAVLSDYLLVIAPDSVHANTGIHANAESYKSRVWCRAEQLAHFCHNGLQTIYLQRNSGQALEPVSMEWMESVCRVFDGDMTCCRLRHPGGRECDRESLVATMLGLYFTLYSVHCTASARDDAIRDAYDLIEWQKEHIFPSTYFYAMDAGEEERSLFGDMIERLECLVKTNVSKALRRCRPLRRMSQEDDVLRSHPTTYTDNLSGSPACRTPNAKLDGRLNIWGFPCAN